MIHGMWLRSEDRVEPRLEIEFGIVKSKTGLLHVLGIGDKIASESSCS